MTSSLMLLRAFTLALAGVVRIDAVIEIDGDAALHLTPAACVLIGTGEFIGTPRGPRLFDNGFEPAPRITGGVS